MSQALFHQLIIILLLVAVGYAGRKSGLFSDGLQRGLPTLVVNVAVPATILASAGTPMEAGGITAMLWVLGGGLVYHLAALLLGNLAAQGLRLPLEKGRVFECLAAFTNVAFIGYPIIGVFLPENGAFYASFFIVAFNLLFYTIGTSRLSGARQFSPKPAFTSLPTLACFVMLALFLLQWKLPGPVQDTLGLLAGLSTPLSMMAIGGMLAGVRIRTLVTTPLLYAVSAMRLLLLPLLVFGVLKLLPVPHDAAVTILVMSALPAGATTAIVAQQYGREAALASQGVLHSTLCFVASLPIVALLAGWL